ncbi:MAG: MFS transporter [Chloroflexi bacterium]|nr:MFS transporter [Chloroflexota bacterium]
MAFLLRALRQTEKPRFRWIMVAANFSVVLILWIPYSSFGVFLPRLAEEFGWQRGAVATVFSIVVIMGVPLGLTSRLDIDQYGPQKVMMLEVALCGIAFLLASLTQNLWQLYLFLGVFLGSGLAGAYIVPTTTTARWFKENRGLAISIVLSGQGLAYLGGPLLIFNAIEALGWRGALAAIGLAVGTLGMLPSLLLRNPPVEPGPERGTGQSGSTILPKPRGISPIPEITLKKALSTSTYWMLLLVWVLQSFALMMLSLHLAPLVTDKGIGLGAAAGALSSFGVGSLAGRLVSGPVTDRLGAGGIVIGTMIVAALAMGTILITPDLMLLYAAALAFGMALSVADTAYVRELPDIVGSQALGMLMGGLSLGFRVGGSAGPAFAGFLFDATGVYVVPFGVAILALLLSSVLFFAASRPERRLDQLLKRRPA